MRNAGSSVRSGTTTDEPMVTAMATGSSAPRRAARSSTPSASGPLTATGHTAPSSTSPTQARLTPPWSMATSQTEANRSASDSACSTAARARAITA